MPLFSWEQTEPTTRLLSMGTPSRRILSSFSWEAPETKPVVQSAEATNLYRQPNTLGGIFKTLISPEKTYQSMRERIVPATGQMGESLGALAYTLTGGKVGSRAGGRELAETFVGRPLRGGLDIPLNVWSAIQAPAKLTAGQVPLLKTLTGTPEESYFMQTLKGQRPQDLYEATEKKDIYAERIGRAALGQLLAAPLSGGLGLSTVLPAMGRRALAGATLGTAFTAIPLGVEAVKTGELPSKEKVIKDLTEGAIRGAENSWMLAFTDLATDKILAGKLANALTGGRAATLQSPIAMQAMRPLVEASKAGAPFAVKAPLFARGALTFLKRALAEVPVENTVWTYLDKLNTNDKTSFFRMWARNLPSTVVGNIAYAGFNTATKGAVPLVFNKADIDAGIQSLKDTAKALVSDPKYQEGFIRLGLGYGEEKVTPTELRNKGISLRKNDLQTLIKNTPELKEKPELTFKEGRLVFEGKKAKMSIIPEAIGLSSQMFNEGDVLDISGALAKTAGNLPTVEGIVKPAVPKTIGEEVREVAYAEPEAPVSNVGKRINYGSVYGTVLDENPKWYTVQADNGGVFRVSKELSNIKVGEGVPELKEPQLKPLTTKQKAGQIFKPAHTGITDYDKVIENKETVRHFGKELTMQEYYQSAKDKTFKIVSMTPQEYLDEIKYVPGSESTVQVNKYAEQMSKGTKFNTPLIDYTADAFGKYQQEGRHRAIAASILGVEKIPVLVINSASNPVAAAAKFGEYAPAPQPAQYKKLYHVTTKENAAKIRETGVPTLEPGKAFYAWPTLEDAKQYLKGGLGDIPQKDLAIVEVEAKPWNVPDAKARMREVVGGEKGQPIYDVVFSEADFKPKGVGEVAVTKPVEPITEVKTTELPSKEKLYTQRDSLVQKQTELATQGKTSADPEYEKLSRQIYQLEKQIYEEVGKPAGEAPPASPPPPPPILGETPEEYVKRSVRRQFDYLTEQEKQYFNDNVVPQVAPIMDKIKGKGKWTQDELLEFAAKKLIVNTKLQSDPQMQKAMVDMLAAGQAFAKEFAKAYQAGEDLSGEGIKAYLKFAQAKSFFGRALKAADMSIDPQTKFFYDTLEAKMLQEIGSIPGLDIEKVAAEAEKVDFDNPSEVTAFYRKYIKPSWFEIWSQYRYVNLLSNPLTQLTNAFSNLIQLGFTKPSTMIASGVIDPIYSKLTGADQTHYLSEIPAYFRGVSTNLGKATDTFIRAFRGQEFMAEPELRYISTGGEAPETDVLGIGKGLSRFGEWGQFIPRLMNASDLFFRDLIAGGEIEAIKASYEARGETPPIDVADKAASDGLYWLYRQGLDPTGEKTGQPFALRGMDKLTGVVMSARSRVPLVNVFIPFVQTPANIVKQGIEFSPLGALDTAVSQAWSKMNPNVIPVADPIEQYAKSLVGSTVMAGALAIITHTDATAEAPSNPDARKRFYATGRKPWHILLPTPFGKQWVSMQRLGAMAYPIALAQLFYDRAYKSEKRFQREGFAGDFDTAVDALHGLASYFADQTYVQGLSDLMGLVNSGGGSFEDYLTRSAAQPIRQAIPFTSFISAIARVIDPIYRKPTGGTIERTAQRVAIGIPFLSKMVDPYTDPLGQPSTRAPLLLNFFNSLITPVQFSPSVTGYFEMLFLTKDMESELNYLKKSVKDGTMTPEQAAEEAEKLIQRFSEETQGVTTELPENYQLEPVLPKTTTPTQPTGGVLDLLPKQTPTAPTTGGFSWETGGQQPTYQPQSVVAPTILPTINTGQQKFSWE